MTTVTRVKRAGADTLALFHRNAIRYRRMPEVLGLMVMQPIVILLLFRYILGGAVALPGIDYLDYLMPGVFALAVINGSATSSIGLAHDLAAGTVDHLRTLPIARSALLSARSLTDLARNLVIIPIVGALGLAVGFQMTTTVPNLLVAYGLLLALGFALAWVSTVIALWTNSVEATQTLTILISLVASFASSGFAPVATMPAWLRGVISASPVTYVDDAVRTLVTNASGPVSHNIVASLVWVAAITAVAVPLAVMRYARPTQ